MDKFKNKKNIGINTYILNYFLVDLKLINRLAKINVKPNIIISNRLLQVCGKTSTIILLTGFLIVTWLG
jgi:hypothetical protein